MLQPYAQKRRDAAEGVPSSTGDPMGDLTAQQTLLLPSLDLFDGNLAQRTHACLRRAILSLKLRPGQMLRKPVICRTLGVSRSPVAEAIALLATDGLVDVLPQAGTFVARLSFDEILEGAFIREALEAAAVEKLALQISEAELARIHRSIDEQTRLLQAGDLQGFYLEDGAMHSLLLSFTGFKRLAYMAESSWLHVDRARRLLLPEPGRAQSTLDEHWTILDALRARNPAAAREAMRYHLQQLVQVLELVAHEQPELFSSR